MATPGVGIGTTSQPSIANVVEQKLRAERVVKSGAGWFITIAVLSAVNSILSMSGTGVRFIFGLGISEVVDAMAHRAGTTGYALDLVINGFVAGLFILIWHFARKGEGWAFWVGMAIYALDGLIVLLFADYLAAAFHGYALYRIYSGVLGISALQAAQAAAIPAGAPIEPH
ncbi:MAG TPA: hypothetical protein VFA68_00235 [Terriglobales bacterium]|nr:hypothetical protein [Terriglobales bacterium]